MVLRRWNLCTCFRVCYFMLLQLGKSSRLLNSKRLHRQVSSDYDNTFELEVRNSKNHKSGSSPSVPSLLL